MNENEFMLQDRLGVIRDTIAKYGEDNFYISFSGGKDSTVVHYLIDMALPNNKIPRVFINTGIEYADIVKFVKELAKSDERIIVLNSGVNISQTLKKYGYPFKSKDHSLKVGRYKDGSRCQSVMNYKGGFEGFKYSRFQCPKKLQYQYEDEFKLKISDKCCYKLKKEPIHQWEKDNNKTIAITGMRKEEGGQRANKKGCIVTKSGKAVKFHPLLVVDEQFEDWFINKYDVRLCRLYYPPFNFDRTGCKGCPFALNLQTQLEIMSRLLPSEIKQCEIIWKPVYEEYRRIGYRLKNTEQTKLFDEEFRR